MSHRRRTMRNAARCGPVLKAQVLHVGQIVLSRCYFCHEREMVWRRWPRCAVMVTMRVTVRVRPCCMRSMRKRPAPWVTAVVVRGSVRPVWVVVV